MVDGDVWGWCERCGERRLMSHSETPGFDLGIERDGHAIDSGIKVFVGITVPGHSLGWRRV